MAMAGYALDDDGSKLSTMGFPGGRPAFRCKQRSSSITCTGLLVRPIATPYRHRFDTYWS